MARKSLLKLVTLEVTWINTEAVKKLIKIHQLNRFTFLLEFDQFHLFFYGFFVFVFTGFHRFTKRSTDLRSHHPLFKIHSFRSFGNWNSFIWTISKLQRHDHVVVWAINYFYYYSCIMKMITNKYNCGWKSTTSTRSCYSSTSLSVWSGSHSIALYLNFRFN